MVINVFVWSVQAHLCLCINLWLLMSVYDLSKHTCVMLQMHKCIYAPAKMHKGKMHNGKTTNANAVTKGQKQMQIQMQMHMQMQMQMQLQMHKCKCTNASAHKRQLKPAKTFVQFALTNKVFGSNCKQFPKHFFVNAYLPCLKLH